METKTWALKGHTIHDHTLSVPWDHNQPDALGTMRVFARQIVAPGGENRPHLCFFQGGPGGAVPRPLDPSSGWLGRLLQDYRVVLLEQRGVGRSTRMDAQTLSALGDLETQIRYASLLRADQIVADAEALRHHLTGGKPWAVFGQSYGGFCITAYLSRHPEAITHAFYTGGTPALDLDADELYRLTYQKVAARHQLFYRKYPDADKQIREVAKHLEDTAETLPTGERLSARRMRMLGINLGRDVGFEALHYLFEDPFVTVGGTKRLSQGFLAEVGAQLSYQSNPLYGLLHETIYAAATPALAGKATNWAAHRMRSEVPGFAEDADPTDPNEPYYLTGEHIYPWQFEEDPALVPLKELAHALAQKTDWPVLYQPQKLAETKVSGAAAIYFDDIFVPVEPSLRTAATIGLEPYITNVYQHSGIGTDGGAILGRLIRLVQE